MDSVTHYRTFHNQMAGTVIKAKLGIEREKALKLGTTMALARDRFVKELDEYLLVMSFPPIRGNICRFAPDYNTKPNIADLTQIVRQGSSITGVQVRDKYGAIYACKFYEIAKLFAEDVNIRSGMPPDGAAGKTIKKESIIKAFRLSANKLSVFIDNFKRDILEREHDLDKVSKTDQEIVMKGVNSLESLYNDYLGETGEDPFSVIGVAPNICNLQASGLVEK